MLGSAPTSLARLDGDYLRILIEDTGIAVASSLVCLVRVDFTDREGKAGRARTKRVASVVWT